MTVHPAPRVLVVDDDKDLSDEIAHYLSAQGFQVSIAHDGAQMDQVLKGGEIDIMVLDLMLPGEDGLSICQRLSNGAKRPPVLMLSALGDDVDRIVGLELGADDYLAKPCVPRELLARLKAILRQKQRLAERGAPSLVYGFCGFRLDILTRELMSPTGATVPLTAGEFLLLRAFLERPGRVLSRDQLLDAAHGQETEVFDRAVDVQLSRLRRKLGRFTDRELIKTCRGAGYLFSEAVDRP